MCSRSKKEIKFLLSLIFISSSILLVGCSPSGILATGGSTAMVVAEGDRSFGTVVDDATIKVNVAAKFLNAGNNLFVDINTTVLEGRVLLTGLVDNQEVRIDAVRLVWEVEGVQEVVNEVEIGNRETIKDYANDLWINTQARAVAAKTVGLRVVAYNFETINGKVYVAGITSKPDQLEKMIDSLKAIKGVREIINYVIIKE
ncbi:BON domain-containing protein [Pelagibacteraceae bacterium]|nr:BON domain-containing protein [Pelagibacteraceae bacterium]